MSADSDDDLAFGSSAAAATSSAVGGAGTASSSSSSSGTRDATGFLPWVEKYRPSELSELISQGDIVNTVTKLINAHRLPHLLFYGPPGTGKTTTILAIAKQLYGKNWQSMTLELNASDDRGIDVVREQIKTFAGTRKLFSSGVKLVILDEADAMTNDAQFALRRVIEKYTKNTRFCLLCNYVSKIIPALQSRCTRFRFAPLRVEDIVSRFNYVIDKEGIAAKVTDDGRSAILRLANGDMRKVLNVLQATATGYDVVDEDAVYSCTGHPKPADVRALLMILLQKPFAESYAALQAYKDKGYALTDILTTLMTMVRLTSMHPDVLTLLYDKCADIEYRLAFGTSEKIQAAALVGAFQQAKAIMKAHKEAGKAATGGAASA